MSYGTTRTRLPVSAAPLRCSEAFGNVEALDGEVWERVDLGGAKREVQGSPEVEGFGAIATGPAAQLGGAMPSGALGGEVDQVVGDAVAAVLRIDVDQIDEGLLGVAQRRGEGLPHDRNNADREAVEHGDDCETIIEVEDLFREAVPAGRVELGGELGAHGRGGICERVTAVLRVHEVIIPWR